MSDAYEYLIVGAGPAGLQLGYYLEQQKRRYLILEAGSGAGAFFEKFPRHRTLISINKMFTGSDDPEFNMRHDWNSLLTDDYSLLFKEYDQKFFPNADRLVEYVRDYATRFKLRVQYQTWVEHVRRSGDEFVLQDRTGREYRATRVVVATGMSRPLLPTFPGIELTENYMDVSLDTRLFENKRVLILGKGNSAFETADHLVSSAALIHLASPRPITMAWKSHYVGNLRAVNNNILDTYQLKSQNAVLDAEVTRITRRGNQLAAEVRYNHASGEVEEICYDHVICCTGFRFDDGIFDDGCRPMLTMNGKYPAITDEFESVNVPNLYFAGTITHSLDYKKATSGFIHGFRYNVRALMKILNYKHHGQHWQVTPVERDAALLTRAALGRVNRAAGLWQQPGFIADVITEDGSRFGYHQELPLKYVDRYCKDRGVNYFVVTLEYGDPIQGDPFNVERIHRCDTQHSEKSQFLHPVVRYFRDGELAGEHHVIEDLEAVWFEKEHVEPLTAFFAQWLSDEPQSKPVDQPAHAMA